MDVAAEMGTYRGTLVQRAALVAVSRDLAEAFADDRALAGLELVNGRKFARRHILGEAFDRRDVLGDEVLDRRGGLAARRVELFPVGLAGLDQPRDQQAGDDAVSQALSGVAGVYEDVFVAGIAPAEGRQVDRVEHLPGPAM